MKRQCIHVVSCDIEKAPRNAVTQLSPSLLHSQCIISAFCQVADPTTRSLLKLTALTDPVAVIGPEAESTDSCDRHVSLRAEAKAASTQHALAGAQQKADELAAEHRVLLEGSKAMRQECNEAWVRISS